MPFNGHVFSMMFDTGCGNFVCRSAAIDALPQENKINTRAGPIVISGVGNQQVTSSRGEYKITMPAYNGTKISFRGICLDVITGTMPPYPVKEVRKFIVRDYVAQGGKEKELPNVPMFVGGDTDFLIGLKYNYYQPRLVHIMPSGLAIYLSPFVGLDGTRGCIGGNHKLFRQCEQQFMEARDNTVAQFRVFLSQRLQLYNEGFRVCLDCDSFALGIADPSKHSQLIDLHKGSPIALTSLTDNLCDTNSIEVEGETANELSESKDAVVSSDDTFLKPSDCVERKILIMNNNVLPASKHVFLTSNVHTYQVTNSVDNNQCSACFSCKECSVFATSSQKLFEKAEDAGTSVSYRCIKCRSCKDCREGEYMESISFKEEREQSIIESTVHVDFENKTTYAYLPFVMNPEEKLITNRYEALKIYNQQIKKLSKTPELKQAVIRAEQK